MTTPTPSTPGWTGGPWLYVPREVLEDGSVYPPHIVGGRRQLQICSFHDTPSDTMAESATDIRSSAANARLIAASPALYAALEKAADELLEWEADNRECGLFHNAEAIRNLIAECTAALNAANPARGGK